MHRGRLRVGRLADDDVLGQVDHHGAGPAGAGDVERLMHHPGKVLGPLHQIVVLGGGTGDAGRVRFLECVVADQVGGHLAGQADHGYAVHQRIAQAGDGVGRAGAGGDQHDAHLTGRPCVALGGVDRAAFLADQDVADGILVEDRVVDRQYRATRIAEDHFHALVLQGAE